MDIMDIFHTLGAAVDISYALGAAVDIIDIFHTLGAAVDILV